tara:strand:+ start:507 stop:1790 length:1284 start_codon:yes stop_codon:yes gene_type:complete
MQITGPSVYEKFTITSKDNNKEVSIIGGITDFQYFEDLHSPTTTAIVQVTNTGNTIEGQSLYNGLPIRGGERVHFKVKTPVDALSESDAKLDYVMYVDTVSKVSNDGQVETFTLHLVSREAITNEQTRVTRKYQGQTIDKTIEQIVSLLEPLSITKFEKCQNTIPIIGNMRKPFTVAVMLAAKGVPVGSKDSSAGFFFWQTRDGFRFKSVDGLIKEALAAKSSAQRYYYRQTVDDPYKNPSRAATQILDFRVNKDNNVVEGLSKGEKSSYRIFFNPLDFTITQPQDSIFKPDSKVKLGGNETEPAVADPENIPINYLAPRIVSGVFNVGALDVGVSTAVNYNGFYDLSQAFCRYSTFFNIDYTILVPCNTNLTAGDPVYLEFPKTTEETPDVDTQQSGLYIIKEITHKFYPTKSYTSMRVVRDTHGT